MSRDQPRQKVGLAGIRVETQRLMAAWRAMLVADALGKGATTPIRAVRPRSARPAGAPVYGSGWLTEQPLVRRLEARGKNDKW